MKLISLIIICVLAFAILVGLFRGLHRGYTRISSFGTEYLLCCLCTVGVGAIVYKTLGKNGGTDAAIAGVIMLLVPVAFYGIFKTLAVLLRKLINSKMQARQELSYYEQYDDMEENREGILDAVYDGDKKKYKKLTKERKSFKLEPGGWRMVDRFIGAFVGMVQLFVITGIVCCVALMILDFARVSALAEIFQTSSWLSFKDMLFDCLFIALMYLCIKCGYTSGIMNSLIGILVLVMLAGAGVFSYYLAFKVSAFDSAAHAITATLGASESVSQIFGSGVSDVVGRIVIAVGLFLIMLVEIIIFAIFIPRLVDMARGSAAFRTTDGILGAVFLVIVAFGVQLVLGWLLSSVSELEFMQIFNGYFDGSKLTKYIFSDNIISEFGAGQATFLRNWFGLD